MPMTLSAYLRDRTRVAHARVEAALPLMQEDLTLPAYLTVLKRLYPLVRALERTWSPFYVAQAPYQGLLGPWHRRADDLAADLRALGATAKPCAQIEARVQQAQLTDALARAVGSNYVMQGARLGGRLIHRHLCKTLPQEAHTGLTYFAQNDVALGALWRPWLARLDANASLWADRDAVVAGAQATFEVWYESLQDIPPAPI